MHDNACIGIYFGYVAFHIGNGALHLYHAADVFYCFFELFFGGFGYYHALFAEGVQYLNVLLIYLINPVFGWCFAYHNGTVGGIETKIEPKLKLPIFSLFEANGKRFFDKRYGCLGRAF